MTTKHTPGPCEVRTHPKAVTVSSHVTVNDTATGATIAVIVMGNGRPEYAALLAAAPRLLEALEQAAGIVDWAVAHGAHPTVRSIAITARAAIKAAKQ